MPRRPTPAPAIADTEPSPVASSGSSAPDASLDAGFFIRLPIEQLHESALNPRRHFHEEKLRELAASIGEHGVLTPLLARPIMNGDGPAFELAAGHRRYRAAKLARLAELPVVVRVMNDRQLLEVLTIENLQREDVHPLEEAQGYADLIKHAGYDVARIAERVGKSVKYVYDRLKLLQLTPEVQEFFFRGEITAGHAILMARLSSDDQARAVKATGALFTFDNGREAPEQELGLEDRRKPMSVRELQTWIDEHVRFAVDAADVPDLFPETAAVVAPAVEKAEKVISITHNFHVDPGAKPEDGERTYTPTSWTRADGRHGSKECERSVLGVIVVGPGRGDAFRVCVDKKKCTVHWGREIKEAAKRAKQREEGGDAQPVGRDRHAEQRARDERIRQQREAARLAFDKVRPQVLEAIATRVKKMPAGPKGALGALLVKQASRQVRGGAAKYLTPGSSPIDLVRYLAFMQLADDAQEWNAHESFPKVAKAFGVDVRKFLKQPPTEKEVES